MTIPWVEVMAGDLPDSVAAATASGVYWQANATTFLLDAPGVARYLAQDSQLAYARYGTTEDMCVRLFGAGLPTAAAWVQRGCLALHAAAVATSAGAVVLAGASASGKSVLAATLVQRGCTLLADEVTPVNLSEGSEARVEPNTEGALFLWRDALDPLGVETGRLSPLRIGLDRYAAEGFSCAAALPLRAIYLMGLHSALHVEMAPVEGRNCVLAVMAASFNRFLPQSPAQQQRTFLALSVLLTAVPVRRLLRPRFGWSAAALADCVLAEVSA